MTSEPPPKMEKPSSVFGAVERLEGRHIVGWAVALPNDRNCEIRVLDDAGRQIGFGRAARSRQDLNGLGLGRNNLGFRIFLNNWAGTGTTSLHVFADQKPLPGSPLVIGRGYFDGLCDYGAGTLRGWVLERHPSPEPPVIEFRDLDNDLLGVSGAIADRQSADPGFTPWRFKFTIPQSHFGQREMIVRVLANGVEFACLLCPLNLDGFLESLSETQCRGWLIAPGAQDTRLEIEVFRDGAKIGSGPCDILRMDVRDLYPQCAETGFDIALDPPKKSDQPTQISLRLRGSNAELFSGPFVVCSKNSAIGAARRLANLVTAGGSDFAPQDAAIMRAALALYLQKTRGGDADLTIPGNKAIDRLAENRRLNIIIPIYRGAEVTRACIQSVLAERGPTDLIVLINDCSPDPGMMPMLSEFLREPNLCLLVNYQNLGFVKTVNRGLNFCKSGDVVLLNSDTRILPGALEELYRVAQASRDIGTVTPLSNNATIFTYPEPGRPVENLPDVTWDEVAEAARGANLGVSIDVPTGHGFCLLIKREVLGFVPQLNEDYGRGYGEENELCLRALDLGFRSVAAAGAFVEHRESISFGSEKNDLLKANLPKLARLFPEFTPTVMEFERQDDLRRARWAVDAYRLAKARRTGRRFALIIGNWLVGGTKRAAQDIEHSVGYDGALKMELTVREDHMVELLVPDLRIRALFDENEAAALHDLLEAADPSLMVIHQLLGYTAAFIALVSAQAAKRHSLYFVHDFYALCERVNLIDSTGSFCGEPEPERCGRCLAMGGGHEASALTLEPLARRQLFGTLLSDVKHVIAPSNDAGARVTRQFPAAPVQAISHPHLGATFPRPGRAGSFDTIVLIGALGSHKGSKTLLELAGRARIMAPALRFHVIGYTDMDKALRALPNVAITGRYEPEELPQLIAEAGGRIALFLHGWPETFSYTISEIVEQGLIPLVPDLGAPAERVRAAGYGAVFPFPIQPDAVIAAIEDLARQSGDPRMAPLDRFIDPEATEKLVRVFRGEGVARDNRIGSAFKDDYLAQSA